MNKKKAKQTNKKEEIFIMLTPSKEGIPSQQVLAKTLLENKYITSLNLKELLEIKDYKLNEKFVIQYVSMGKIPIIIEEETKQAIVNRDMILFMILNKENKETYPTYVDLVSLKALLRGNKDMTKALMKYTKSTLHFEDNKIQSKKDSKTNILKTFDEKIKTTNNYDDKEKYETMKLEIIENNIQYKGIDLTESEYKAIHSIQTLMTDKEYYDEYTKTKEIKPFEFTPSEFLEAYGVKKHITSRGKFEYSGEGRSIALASLRNLIKKQCYVYYETIYYDGKRNKRVEIIEEITTLLTLANIYNLPIEEREDFWKGKINKNERLTKIALIPHKVLVEDIDKKFVMKPKNYIKEIPKPNNYKIAFIDELHRYVTHNTITPKIRKNFNWILERGWKELAINIRLDKSSYWKKRMWTKCREIIIEIYNMAKELGYIIDYELNVEGKTKELDRLYLNKNEFYQPSNSIVEKE